VFRPAAWRLGVVLVQQKEKLLHGALRGSPARRIDVSRSLTLAMRHTPLTCGPATLPQWEDEPEHLVHTVGSATATVQHFTCRTESGLTGGHDRMSVAGRREHRYAKLGWVPRGHPSYAACALIQMQVKPRTSQQDGKHLHKNHAGQYAGGLDVVC
jgi:hypothetical protein